MSRYISSPQSSGGTSFVWNTRTANNTEVAIRPSMSAAEANTVSLESMLLFENVPLSSGTGIQEVNVTLTPDAYRLKRQAQKTYEPAVFFRYVKAKFSMLEEKRLKSKLDELELAIKNSFENGQIRLGKKFEAEWMARMREAEIHAVGFGRFVEADEVHARKHKIKGGHISDTLLADYTRVIPQKVIKKIEKAKRVFDDFVIYHYWNEDATDVKKMDPIEKSRMKDPIVFGVIKETDRLYFVADWIDEHCDLTFDEMVTVVAEKVV